MVGAENKLSSFAVLQVRKLERKIFPELEDILDSQNLCQA